MFCFQAVSSGMILEGNCQRRDRCSQGNQNYRAIKPTNVQSDDRRILSSLSLPTQQAATSLSRLCSRFGIHLCWVRCRCFTATRSLILQPSKRVLEPNNLHTSGSPFLIFDSYLIVSCSSSKLLRFIGNVKVHHPTFSSGIPLQPITTMLW